MSELSTVEIELLHEKLDQVITDCITWQKSINTKFPKNINLHPGHIRHGIYLMGLLASTDAVGQIVKGLAKPEGKDLNEKITELVKTANLWIMLNEMSDNLQQVEVDVKNVKFAKDILNQAAGICGYVKGLEEAKDET